MSVSREHFNFGSGSFIGTISRHPEFFEADLADQARMLAWVAGCPVPEELIENRGPEAMVERYGQIAFWYGYVVASVQKQNPNLVRWLRADNRRFRDEPVGKYEPQSVPDSYQETMAPMATLPGYALPRLFIEQAAVGKGLSTSDAGKRLNQANVMLREASLAALTPSELMVIFADNMDQAGKVDEDTILKHMVPKGWFVEHQAQRDLQRVKKLMRLRSPDLYRRYVGLSDQEKQDKGLA